MRWAHVIAILWVAMAPLWVRPQNELTPAPRIPDSEIASLRAELGKSFAKRASSVDRRRACKNIARKGAALVDAYPTAPNRYRVLGIMLQSQKRLLGLDNTDRNREALFTTCSELAQAPNAYAELRLEADMLLSERDLSARDATLAERVQALKEMIERYRGTAAEAKSLMMASLIAPELDARELQREIVGLMDERFADDTDVITFRRNNLSLTSLAVKCKGKYARADGTTLFIPADRIGHQCLMVYWSQKTPGFEIYLQQVKEHQVRYPDIFEVYSFNLDELADAGEKELRALGLDWTAVHLPGGRKSEAFRAYAGSDPVALLVNAYGYTILTPESVHSDSTVGMRGARTGAFKIDDARISDGRYLAQLQSLFIGDFLVASADSDARFTGAAESLPAETLQPIQDCFIAPPFRYRLTSAEALGNYRQAEKLCRDALQKYPEVTDLWRVRNRRIVALLGMWNLTGEPTYLEQAVQEAKAALATATPKGVDVVPRFCLAKEALRRESPDPASVLPAFIEATGGTNAPASATAAAAILALDVNSRELHERYRSLLLEDPQGGNPSLWSVRSFLRNRYHRFHLLKPNYSHRETGSRAYIVNHGLEPMTSRLPTVELKCLDGGTLNLPRDMEGKLTLLLFVEPPADPDADFPVVLDRKGNPTRNDYIRTVMKYATDLADQHVNGDVHVIAAFLCDDEKRVDSLMKSNAWTCQAAMVPGGLANPLVRRLGILSADRVPNVFLLRRDGSVAWQASGLRYKVEFGYPFAFLLAMKVHIEACEVQTAYEALKKGDDRVAARMFSGPFLPANPDRYGWRSPRYHGRALAHMGLKDWGASLEDIDMAIDAHKLQHSPHKRGRRPDTWREDVADVTVGTPCDVVAELWITKAIILEHLGRREEAAALRKRAAGPIEPDDTSPYGLFHSKLKELRVGQY